MLTSRWHQDAFSEHTKSTQTAIWLRHTVWALSLTYFVLLHLIYGISKSFFVGWQSEVDFSLVQRIQTKLWNRVHRRGGSVGQHHSWDHQQGIIHLRNYVYCHFYFDRCFLNPLIKLWYIFKYCSQGREVFSLVVRKEQLEKIGVVNFFNSLAIEK